MKIEPVTIPVSEKERAVIKGELNSETINAKILTSGYSVLEPFELKYLKENVLQNNDPSESQLLEYAQNLKLLHLRNICRQKIMGRFTTDVGGNSYQFSCDMEAQTNFEKADNAFSKNRMTETNWTAYTLDGEMVRVTLNPTTFEPVYIAHLTHIQNHISRLRDHLQPIVEKCVTPEEVSNVTWDTE